MNYVPKYPNWESNFWLLPSIYSFTMYICIHCVCTMHTVYTLYIHSVCTVYAMYILPPLSITSPMFHPSLLTRSLSQTLLCLSVLVLIYCNMSLAILGDGTICHISACMSVGWSVYLDISYLICIYVNESISLAVCQSVFLYVSQSVCV